MLKIIENTIYNMKIKKFNESANDKWTNDKLRIFINDHEYLTMILKKYLKKKVTDRTIKKHEGDPDYELYNFFFDEKRQFVMKYTDVEDFTGYDFYLPDNQKVIKFINSLSNFKKWSIDMLFEHCEEHMYLINTFEDYLRYKIINYKDNDFCGEIDFFFSNQNFLINFTDNQDEHNTYQVKNYEEMLEFLSNPDLFLNARKYNL